MDEQALACNLDIERLALAAILLNSPSAEAELDSLHAAECSTEAHRRILDAMRLVSAQGLSVDRMALIEQLQATGKLDSVCGLSYLADLDTGMPQVLPATLDSWIQILHKTSALRMAAHVGQHVVNRVLALEGNVAEILADAQERLGAIGQNGVGGLRVAALEDMYKVDFTGTEYLKEPEVPEGALVGVTGDSESGKSSKCTADLRDISASGRQCLILDRDNPHQVVRDRFEWLGVPECAIRVGAVVTGISTTGLTAHRG